MVLQEEDIKILKACKSQIMPVVSWEHTTMGGGGVYWDTNSPVVNWMTDRDILNLITLRELHTKSVDFFMEYTQDDIKSKNCKGIPIVFGG